MERKTSPQSASPLFARLCILLIVIITAISLLGWLTNSLIFARLRQDFIPVAPSTALSFILLAASLFVHLGFPGNRRVSLFTTVVAFLVIGFSLVVLGQYFGILKTEIEKLLVRNPPLLDSIPMGRMSPVTAVGLLFGGLSLVSLRVHTGRTGYAAILNVFPFVTTFIGFVILVGYAYGSPILYGSDIIPVALPTGLILLLTGLGFLAVSDPRGWPLNLVLGDTLQADLLRAFLPTILILFFSWDLVRVYFLQPAGLLKPLLSSLYALASILVITLLVLFIARKKGADIDQMGREVKQMLDESEKSRLALLGILEDEMAAQLALQTERNFATQLMNVMGQGLTVTDLDGRFIFVNPAYATLLGYSTQELIGKRPEDVTSADDLDSLQQAVSLRLQGKTNTYENKLIRSDGKTISVLITGVPRIQDDQVVGSIVTVTDLSERKQVEDRLAEQVSELRRWQSATLGRENRLLELKHEVNQLLALQGEALRYPSAEQDQPSPPAQ